MHAFEYFSLNSGVRFVATWLAVGLAHLIPVVGCCFIEWGARLVGQSHHIFYSVADDSMNLNGTVDYLYYLKV